MVGTRDPKGRTAGHAVIAGKNILKRVVQRMPHVEDSGNIRRRHHYRKRLVCTILWSKQTIVQPCLVDAILKLLGIIGLRQLDSLHIVAS
ncbi:hypothetical protein SDC9_90051 [bioreactor metagenome]|uniref:Uncharacterized protein n=1 Tax=bioreactor metagenome TaxID=1076179 RepID=A0A644ZSK8_9ZZZZ